MLPADAASFRIVDGQIVPDWLGAQDEPWLRDLLARAEAALDGTMRDLDERLRAPLPRAAPPRRVRMATEVLRRHLAGRAPRVEPHPTDVREVLFRCSSVRRRGEWARQDALTAAASELALAEAEIERVLFLDLPSERRVTLSQALPDPATLARQTNLALAQALLHRATVLQIDAFGNARDLVRHVRLRGLLCVVLPRSDGVRMEISGPFALFRRTTLYGRAYASVVPRLPWCERFVLRATCGVRGTSAALRLGPDDPIYPSPPPRQFDSKLEAAFARDLARQFPDWRLTREPEPVEADGVLVFPDFALYRAAEPDRRWLVELVGFWTPEYLKTKLARLQHVQGWLVAIDAKLNCAEDALPDSLGVVRFQRRIDPASLVALTERTAPYRPRGAPEVVALGAGSYFLDWAGRAPEADPLHARLLGLTPGSAVGLRAEDGFLWVVDAGGDRVAALASAERARWEARLHRVRAVRVREVLERRREQSGAAYRDRLRTDRWRVPLIDIEWTTD